MNKFVSYSVVIKTKTGKQLLMDIIRISNLQTINEH